jgi:ribosomal protein L28
MPFTDKFFKMQVTAAALRLGHAADESTRQACMSELMEAVDALRLWTAASVLRDRYGDKEAEEYLQKLEVQAS